MAANIKGLTVEIGGDTTKLGKALESVNKKSQDLSGELKDINGLLKFNPGNAELLAQKQKVLAEAVSNTAAKLDKLKQAESQVQAQFERGEVSEDQVRALQREIIAAEKKLAQYERAAKETADEVNGLGKSSNSAKDDVEKLGKEAKQSGEQLNGARENAKAFGDAAKTAGKVAAAGFAAAAAAAAATIGATSKASTDSAAYADSILTLSAVTGVSTDALQAYSYAAELVDVSVETLSKSMAKNVKSMSSAASGTGAYAEAYKRLGISVTDSAGNLRDGETVYWEAIDALGKLSNETERDALSMQIFGKSAQELNPLIEAGASKMRELTEEAKAVGAVMSQDALEAFGSFDDSLQRLKGSAGAAKNALGGVLLPELQMLVDSETGLMIDFTNQLNASGGGLEGFATSVNNMSGEIVDTLSGLVSKMLDSVTAVMPAIGQVAVGLVTSLTSKFIEMLPQLVTTAVQMANSLIEGLNQSIPLIIQAIADAIPQLADALVQGVPQIMQGAVTLLLTVVDAIPLILPPLIEALPTIIMSVVNGLLDAIPQLLDGALQFLLAIVDAIPLLVETLIPMLPEIVTTIINGLLDAIPQLLDAAVTLLLSIVKAIPQICVALVKALPQIWTTMFNYLKELPGRLWEILKSMVQNIVRWGEESCKSAAEGAANILSAIVNVIKELPAKIWETLSTIVTKIVQFGANAVNKAKAVASNIFNAIVGGIKTLPDRAKTIGSDLIKSLWNGIKDMASWVKSKISGFASDVLDGIKEFFGISSSSSASSSASSSSNSAVMRDEVGKNIVTGLSAGIVKNEKIAMKSAERMAKKVVESAETEVAKVGKTADEIAKETLDAAKKRFDIYETYNDLTLAEEVSFWDETRKQIEAGTDARLDADKKYLSAKKQFDSALLSAQTEYQSAKEALDKKLLEAEETYQKAVDSTKEKIEQRTQAILTSLGLFQAFEAKEADGHELILNMYSQVSALEEWNNELLLLKARIGETDLYEEIKSQGVDALGQLKAINSMTLDEIKRYEQLFDERTKLARSQATSELQDENDRTIADAYQDYLDTVDSLAQEGEAAYQKYIDKCVELGANITTVEEEITTATETALAALTDSTAAANKAMVDSAQTSLSAINDVAVKLQSLQALMGLTGLGPIDVSTSSSQSPSVSSQLGVSAVISKLDSIYERLGRLQVYLDGHTLVGGIIDDIDAALGDKRLLSARGV